MMAVHVNTLLMCIFSSGYIALKLIISQADNGAIG